MKIIEPEVADFPLQELLFAVIYLADGNLLT